MGTIMHSCTMSIACPPIDCMSSGWGLIQYGTCRPVDTSPYEHNDTHSWKHYLPVENITFLWLRLQTVINLHITRRHTTVFVLNHVTPMGWVLKCISLKRYKVSNETTYLQFLLQPDRIHCFLSVWQMCMVSS